MFFTNIPKNSENLEKKRQKFEIFRKIIKKYSTNNILYIVLI